MLLTSVVIKNFRSVAEVTLDFTSHRAISLVGLNEAGKSNILRALSLISQTEDLDPNDVRVPGPHEQQIEEAYVSFNFRLSDHEILDLVETLRSKTISPDAELPQFIGENGVKAFKEFALSRATLDLRIDLISHSRDYWGLQLDEEFCEIENGWLYVKDSDEVVPIAWMYQDSVPLAEMTLARISTDSTDEILDTEILDAKILDAEWHAIVSDHVSENLPAALFWTYDKENVLPGSVSLEEFANDPKICNPLKGVFEIADVTDISSAIRTEELRGRHRLNSLLSRIGLRASNHLKTVWKDYKPASIELQLDGAEIRISIRDENLSFNFIDRSEGFKRFMTFLIMISAKAKTNELENTILLVDEPEASLHPSGVRNLRDELLRIGQKSCIVYATHSPHMIDSSNIDRHIIVKKKNEVTECQVATSERLFDEEVILNSLGTSLFDALKPINLVFEGWRDKKLFEVYNLFVSKTNESRLNGCGVCFTQGVKDIKNILPILMLAQRHAIVVTDHDDPAIDARKALENSGMMTPWKTYRECEGTLSKATTAEDFIRPSALKKAFEQLCREKGLEGALDEEELRESSRLEVIKSRAQNVGVDGKEIKRFLDEFKSRVFDELVFDEIDDRYHKVYESLRILANGMPLTERQRPILTVAISA